MEVLGVGWGDKTKKKEKKRLAMAEQTARDLRVIPGGRKYKLGLAQALSGSQATYGRLCKQPSLDESRNVDKATLAVAHRSQASCPELLRLTEGGASITRVVAAQRL